MSAERKQAVEQYVRQYGPEVDMIYLRGFVHSQLGAWHAYSGLSHDLRKLGYRKMGVRKIETCPGTSTFYLKEA